MAADWVQNPETDCYNILLNFFAYTFFYYHGFIFLLSIRVLYFIHRFTLDITSFIVEHRRVLVLRSCSFFLVFIDSDIQQCMSRCVSTIDGGQIALVLQLGNPYLLLMYLVERENPPPVGISLYIELPSSPLQSLDLVRQLSLSTSQKHLHLDQLYCDSWTTV